jgi:ATP-dependent Clp protease ATP-binding subunit ClpA
MNGYNFTERVRKVLAMAREEAARLHHEYVGTEHLLLGLVREGEGVAATVLQNLGVELGGIQRRIEETVKKAKAGQTIGPDLPYTSPAKKVLELAMAEARYLNHQYVGTEHLLLGLIREEHGAAAQVITSSGITIDAARAGVLEILGTESQAYQEFKRRRTFGVGREMARTSAPSWMMARLGPPMAGPTSMAASVLEALMQDAGVAEVFIALRIDARTLIAALRAASFRALPGEASGESAGDSPSESPA